MHRRHSIRIVLVVVLVLGFLVYAIYRSREPRYQGRTLSEWVGDGASAYAKFTLSSNADPLHPDTDPDWQAASHAVQQIDSDAIPFLLRWAQAKDSRLKARAINWLLQHPVFHLQIRSDGYYHDVATFGLRLLGDKAKPAFPTLIQWTKSEDPTRRAWAIETIVMLNPGKETLMPLFLRSIHDPDRQVRYLTAFMFHYLYPQDAEAAGVYKMFPDLENAPVNRPNTNQNSVR